MHTLERGWMKVTDNDNQLLDVIKQGFPVLHLGVAVTVPRLPVAVTLKEMLQRFHLRHDAGERQRQL